MENKISVIIPAYNIEGYIARTLDSVLSQSYENIEVIVVNDGSKDKTGEIIDLYATKVIRVKAVHKENGGVTAARLRGVEEASGQWIGFVDGDDLIDADMYERLMNNALEVGTDISHCGYKMVFPNRVDYYYNTNKKIVQEGVQGLRDIVSGAFVEPGLCNKLYKKELFEGLSQWMDTSIKNTEDLLMNYYLFRSSKRAVYEDFCPYNYMLRRGSATTSKINKNKLLDPQRVIKRLIVENSEIDKDKCIENLLAEKLARSYISISTMSDKEQPTLIRPAKKQSRKELRGMLSDLLKSGIPQKVKIMSLWAAVWPWSYGFVHKMYSKVTGNDKKYSID